MAVRTAPARIPGIGQFHLPLSRNDLLLALVAFTEIGTGLETYLAHLISGGIKPAESIPVIFGPTAGAVLLFALFLRIRQGVTLTSTLIVLGVAASSIFVGILGTAFHWARTVPPPSVGSQALQWDWIIYAPPVLGPLAFAGIGIMAIIALLEDTKPETGKLTLPGVFTVDTPMAQTRQFLWLVAFGLYAATVSSFLDHGRTEFENIFVWIPTVLGLYGSVTTTLMAIYERHTSTDYFIFFWTMVIMMLMGMIGVGFHINYDLPETGQGLVFERFIRGAPIMAPMLFTIMGIFGIITMVNADTGD